MKKLFHRKPPASPTVKDKDEADPAPVVDDTKPKTSVPAPGGSDTAVVQVAKEVRDHKNTCHCCGRKVGRWAVKKKLKLRKCCRCQEKVCSSCSTRSICAKCKIKFESRSKIHSPADVARLSEIEMERLMYALDIDPGTDQLASDIFAQLEQSRTDDAATASRQGHEDGELFSDGEMSDDESDHVGAPPRTGRPPQPIAVPVDKDHHPVPAPANSLPTEVESLCRIPSAAYFETLSIVELKTILDNFQVQYTQSSTRLECVQLTIELWLSYVDMGSTSSESGSTDATSVRLRDIVKAEDINALDVTNLRTLLDEHDIDYNDCWIKWELAYRVKRLWTILNADGVGISGLENNLCVCCLLSPINCSVLSCGHKATCLPCGHDSKICPVCCGPVEGVVPFAVARRTGPVSSAKRTQTPPPPPPPLKPNASFR